MTLECEVISTPSGMKAMRDRRTGEVMHPSVGPEVEAERLYVAPSRLRARLEAAECSPVVVFDVGLGAGGNALAAWKLAENGTSRRRLALVSFDQSSAALELALAPEHAADFGFDERAVSAARALLAQGRHESARASWQLVAGDLTSTLSRQPPASADVVFWDAFSPHASPELWTVRIFETLRGLCRSRASVHTYSRATATRSALLLAGFAVGEASAASKAGTIAVLDAGELERPLDRCWFERLVASRARFPPDAPADALERIRALPQFEPRL